MYYFVVAWDTFLNKWSSRVLNLSAVIAHSSGYRILSQQYSSLSSVSACVPAREEEEERRWTLRLCPFFYKAISNSLQCLLDNPDTVHLLQQQGFMVSFQFSLFLFFFLICRAFCQPQREWESLLRYSRQRRRKAIACGRGQKLLELL